MRVRLFSARDQEDQSIRDRNRVIGEAKIWVTGPGRERWEVYTVLADARPDLGGHTDGAAGPIRAKRLHRAHVLA